MNQATRRHNGVPYTLLDTNDQQKARFRSTNIQLVPWPTAEEQVSRLKQHSKTVQVLHSTTFILQRQSQTISRAPRSFGNSTDTTVTRIA
jgi:hypothetical protein